MSERRMIAVEGNEGAASAAYRLSEVISIYPITPSSTMAELSDEWAVKGRTNIWGTVPDVVQMQSEAGAAGAVHGALQAGALATSFTASQGLLLFIPNLYKIAGELNACVIHVAARAVAHSALSIFGEHSDVMACRQTGFALLASNSVQEAHDLACIAHMSTLRARVPFLHFFDGFRTSHEVNMLEELSDDDLRSLIDDDLIRAHRERALNPDHPFVRGTAANPDAFFQMREAVNPFYAECPRVVREAMERFEVVTGRSYHLFDYAGHPEAERVVVVMGSGAEVTQETVEWLAAGRDERVGVVKVRLYRPFSVEEFMQALPPSVRSIAVLDRTKEPGSVGEPLYQDVVAALEEARAKGLGQAAMWEQGGPRVIGGRFGLGSKEFDPAMVKSVLDELAGEQPKKHFTIGINDDVSHTSLAYDPAFDIEADEVVRAVFFGLGADGTVGANKNSIKIIGEESGRYAQGYFVYDSKKSGGVTVSHLRFGPKPIHSSYLIKRASFVACHQYRLLDKLDILSYAAPDATLLLNTPYAPEEVWGHLARPVQEEIVRKNLKLWAIDAFGVAKQLEMGFRINTIMQTCFFAISSVLPREEAIEKIKESIVKTYGKKGGDIVKRNFEAVDGTLAALYQIEVPRTTTVEQEQEQPTAQAARLPQFIRDVTVPMLIGRGDELPVSALPVDGTFPSGSTKYEKRNIALEIPIWDPAVCIQCGRCSFACPHASIRTKLVDEEALRGAPRGFKSVEARGARFAGKRYVVQVAPEDCTGCRLCVSSCPGKDRSNPSHKAINMGAHAEHVDRERANFDFFLALPSGSVAELEERGIALDVKTSQLMEPLFQFSLACAGCGETQYLRLLTQLFGDRLLIANATGCSSIYGGNLPTTPWDSNKDGRGPAWSNSLFEDAAEFGLGFRLAVDAERALADRLLTELAPQLGNGLANKLLGADQQTVAGIERQRARVEDLLERLHRLEAPEARRLAAVASSLVQRSVWSVGGDGWAYDIGFGGLDHVLYLNRRLRLLVLDSEVYSNTGGQVSKSSPMGAVAKFAANGKDRAKKDLGMMAMTYGTAYVAQVAWGANEAQTVRALLEAESYPGTSLVIGYAHCIGHGYDLAYGREQQRLAVESGRFPLYRFDPRRLEQGLNPLQLDSRPPSVPLHDYMEKETRFRMLERLEPDRAREILDRAQRLARRRYRLYEQLAALQVNGSESAETSETSTAAAAEAPAAGEGAESAANAAPVPGEAPESAAARESRGGS